MKEYIVTVENLESGLYPDWRGQQADIRGLQTGDPEASLNGHPAARVVSTWACEEIDLEMVIDKVSREWVGHEIKIFKLAALSTRVPGEIRTKQLSKDGVLPS